jgi:hypothetical protein
MKQDLLDMVWPALYVSQTFWKFWFLIIGTILVETFVIRWFLKFSWKKSFIASLIGNSVSGIIGTFIMVWAMLFWHLVADNFVPNGTFGIVNWIATYILMCLGSVLLETIAIKLFYKEKIKQLFLPMFTGNFLSYAFIAYVMFTATNADPDEKRAELVKFLPDKLKFVLLDGSKMKIDTSRMRISYDKNGRLLNDLKSSGYDLNILFKKQNANDFQFDFRSLDTTNHSGGIDNTSKMIHFEKFEKEYKILLEQKNSDTSVGWEKPMVTDTLVFKRI